jgi:glycosyltransferase involved in cell wall biosynthesis
MSILPIVSIIIPCRNEENFIGKCLDSIISNDIPKNNLEVLIIDGMSEDKTREIIKKYSKRYTFISVIDNPQKIVPTALNLGIKRSKGSIIMRMDAHNIYDDKYISKCVKYSQEFKVDNVGGIWKILPGNNTLISKSIALATSHPFSAGNAYYKVGSKEPKYVDTVPFGCFRKEIFKKIGFFDEDLIRNQDDEFNHRIIKNKGKILLVPDIISYYYARDSLFNLWKMYYQYGYFKPLVLQKIGRILTLRQFIPAIFISSLITSGLFSLAKPQFFIIFFVISLFYLFFNLLFSFLIATKQGLTYFAILPFVFLIFHLSYGIGYLKGIFDFMILKKNKRKKIRNIPLTR